MELLALVEERVIGDGAALLSPWLSVVKDSFSTPTPKSSGDGISLVPLEEDAAVDELTGGTTVDDAAWLTSGEGDIIVL